MFDEPINFKEAEESLSKRLDTPTALKYKEIAATWDAKARSRAFFSARVADATILSELHNRVAAVIEGKMTKTQARDLIRRYFVGDGADALAALGFAPPGDGKGLTQLASAARLKLIFDTNVKMAQEVGQYQQWQEMSHVYRYGIWKAGHAEEHRQEHLARDGKAYAYDHPIWTQSPPGGEFNCHCYRILARDEDLQERGITPEPLGSNFEASSLGFDPSRDLDPPEFGRRVRPEYRERAQEKIDAFAVERTDAVGPVAVPASVPDAEFLPQAAPDTAPNDNIDRFEGAGVASCKVTNPRIKEGIGAAQDAIAEITGAKAPPFNSTHRLMTEEEIKEHDTQETETQGLHVVLRPRGKGGKKWHDIAIRPDCPYPAFTDMHEMVHAYIAEGIIREKEAGKIYKLIQLTATYEKYEKMIRKIYKEKRIHEWATMAITWHWMNRASNEIIQKEKLALLSGGDYGNHIIWKGFAIPTDSRLADIELEEEIMKLTPKTFFGKLKRKLGLTDAPRKTMPMPTKPGDHGYDTVPIYYGFTRKDLDRLCAEQGMTTEEYIAKSKKYINDLYAGKYDDKPLHVM